MDTNITKEAAYLDGYLVLSAAFTFFAVGKTFAAGIQCESGADVPIIHGEFTGEIRLTLKLSGIQGTINAVFEGYSLLQGHVKFGTRPKACITLPGFDIVGAGI